MLLSPWELEREEKDSLFIFFKRSQEMENQLELALWLLLQFTYLSPIHFREMAQATTSWKLNGGLSPASSASELGLQKEGWAASHILHHEMAG